MSDRREHPCRGCGSLLHLTAKGPVNPPIEGEFAAPPPKLEIGTLWEENSAIDLAKLPPNERRLIEDQRQKIEKLTAERDAARANFLKARDARDAAISRAEQAEKALAESRRIR